MNSLGALRSIQSCYSGCQAGAPPAPLLCAKQSSGQVREGTSLLCGLNSDHLHKVRAEELALQWAVLCRDTQSSPKSVGSSIIAKTGIAHASLEVVICHTAGSDTAFELTWSWSRHVYHALHYMHIPINCFIFLTQVRSTLRQELEVSIFGVWINYNGRDRQEESNYHTVMTGF